MSAKDKFHDIVRLALEKDRWNITNDPLYIDFGQVQMRIDLGAEKLLAAEKEGEKIAVEIKSFLNPSAITDFHLALGQFLNYRTALREKEPERHLYLAVDLETYNDFFTLPFIQLQIQEFQLKLVIYDTETEEIIRWIS
ncbi:fatty-acid oxidation protein subunit alpha [Nostoc sp. RF31YmG]|nr:fatty-acid oxidation protein subunit alpha [Nostoc sp. RF31YmG]